VTYDPSRLRGISAYREMERELQLAIASSGRLQIVRTRSLTATWEPSSRSPRMGT
jgi:hypothetical protein